MQSQPPRPLVQVKMVSDVAVVRFTHRSFLSPDLIEAVGQQLFELAEKDDCRKFVIDCGNVESMTTAMVSKLVQLHRKVEAGGGRLALCRIGPLLFQIFTILNLPQVIPIYGNEQEALQ